MIQIMANLRRGAGDAATCHGRIHGRFWSRQRKAHFTAPRYPNECTQGEPLRQVPHTQYATVRKDKQAHSLKQQQPPTGQSGYPAKTIAKTLLLSYLDA